MSVGNGNHLLLGPMLRYVDARSATIWVETEHPAKVCALGSETRTFTVHGRHYGLIMIEGLEPGETIPYTIELDGRQVWPEADSELPASVIRTPTPGGPVSILVGSCRAAAPHEPPYTLELTLDHEGRGVDTLWAHGRRMAHQPIEEWPHLLLLVGDQIYADDSSPGTKERIERHRPSGCELPPEIVAGFEEYCWLYHEAWSSPIERWLLSTVPSAMIFDDHDMIDDWNISASWVEEIRREPWWAEHAIGGVMSYWIYQHLGNLSPDRIRDEGLLARLQAVDDGTEILRAWAMRSEDRTPLPGGYGFSHARTVGNVTVIVVDCRNGRVLDGDTRLMVGEDEWAWVGREADGAVDHLLLATSVPVFIPDGLHDLQVWNERICAGAWGNGAARIGEKIRRGLDLEDWPAFGRSYQMFVELLERIRTRPSPLKSIVIASGDIHFSYAAQVPLRGRFDGGGVDGRPPVWQVVSSPTRNALIPPERGVMRASLTRAGRHLGNLLRLASRAGPSRPGIELVAGPYFANNMCELHYRGPGVELSVEQSTPDEEGNPELQEVARIGLVGSGRPARPTSGSRLEQQPGGEDDD